MAPWIIEYYVPKNYSLNIKKIIEINIEKSELQNKIHAIHIECYGQKKRVSENIISYF